MTILKKYQGPDAEDPGKDLAEATLAYMEENPDISYQKASDIIFKKNPEIARAYTGGQDAEVRKSSKTAYRQDMDASKEISQRAEIGLLERGLSYMDASEYVHKTEPELFKRYCAQIIED